MGRPSRAGLKEAWEKDGSTGNKREDRNVPMITAFRDGTRKMDGESLVHSQAGRVRVGVSRRAYLNSQTSSAMRLKSDQTKWNVNLKSS